MSQPNCASPFTPSTRLHPLTDRTGSQRAAGLLLPLIPAGAAITPELDAVLTAAARAAQAGDRAARNVLFLALQPKIRRFVFRCARWRGQQSAAWEAEDLAQEAFLIFDRLIAAWPGSGPFTPYFLSYFPRRLQDTVRRGGGFRPVCPPPSLASRSAIHSVTDDAPLLDDLAATLPADQAKLLLLHIRDGHSFARIARDRGVHPLTVRRHWRKLLQVLRAMLAENGGTRHA